MIVVENNETMVVAKVATRNGKKFIDITTQLGVWEWSIEVGADYPIRLTKKWVQEIADGKRCALTGASILFDYEQNNAQPIFDGPLKCSSDANSMFVIPFRLGMMSNRENTLA